MVVPELPELLDTLPVLLEELLLLLVPPVHDSPQIEATSLTHCELQLVSQQYESVAQICVAQGSQPVVSLAPDVQMECAHVPLPELLAVVLALVLPLLVPVLPPAPVVDMVTPHGVATGMHTLVAVPSALLTGMQASPEGQAPPPEQSVAQ